MRQKWEGYVLKDPAAPYVFGKTVRVQKVKLAGPDINAGVIGAGFSLNTNPRRWGLATAIRSQDASQEELDFYCRTESLEGDASYKALQTVLGLQSRIRIQDIAEEGTLPVPDSPYHVKVVASSRRPIVELAWHKEGRMEGTVRIPREALSNVQWLCSPWECPFALSLHGDLRPLEESVPRHPVGRVEFVSLQASPTWDSKQAARRKFEDAQTLDACVEMHVLRRIQRLRALPPTRAKLEEVRRTVVSWMACDASDDTLPWPQLPPSGFVSGGGLSHEWESARTQLQKRLPAHLEPILRSAMRTLDPEECQAVFNMPPRSQWLRMHTNATKSSVEVVEDEALVQRMREKNQRLKENLLKRLALLKAAVGKGVLVWPYRFTQSAMPSRKN